MADVSGKAIGLFEADSYADIGDGTSTTWVAGKTWWFDTTAMSLKVWNGSSWVLGVTDAIEFVMDGGASTLTTGVKGYLEVPFACIITRVTTLLDVSGSIVVDIWKDTYANYPPTDADSITASAPPTVSSATKAQDSTLTGWNTNIAAGDILGFNIDSIATATKATVSLRISRQQ